MYLNCRGDKDAQERFEMLMGKTTDIEKNDNDNEGSMKDNKGSMKDKEGSMKDNEDHNKHKKKKKKKKHKHKRTIGKVTISIHWYVTYHVIVKGMY